LKQAIDKPNKIFQYPTKDFRQSLEQKLQKQQKKTTEGKMSQSVSKSIKKDNPENY
jgi:hypothetical protein